jgi:glucosylceramidase
MKTSALLLRRPAHSRLEHAPTDRSGQYWAFAHYSKSIEGGACVIASHPEWDGISHVALENPSGSHILAIANQAEAQPVQCQSGGQAFDLTLDRNSVTTVTW